MLRSPRIRQSLRSLLTRRSHSQQGVIALNAQESHYSWRHALGALALSFVALEELEWAHAEGESNSSSDASRWQRVLEEAIPAVVSIKVDLTP